MENCFFEFEVADDNAFERLQKFFYAIKAEKENEVLDADDSKWLDYFDADVLSKFWWPTSKELEEYVRLWSETPIEQRLTDPELETLWDFESMIDAFANGEYKLISCEKISEKAARLEFHPFSWPYGGSDVFKALIEYCGFKIIREEV